MVSPKGIFYGQFNSLGYVSLFTWPGRALGQKEPCSLFGSQALGRVRESVLLHSWHRVYRGHSIWKSSNGAMISR